MAVYYDVLTRPFALRQGDRHLVGAIEDHQARPLLACEVEEIAEAVGGRVGRGPSGEPIVVAKEGEPAFSMRELRLIALVARLGLGEEGRLEEACG